MCFHGFHRSHRFGPFFCVLDQFFKVFFAPKPLKNAGISWGDSSDTGHLGDGFGGSQRLQRIAVRPGEIYEEYNYNSAESHAARLRGESELNPHHQINAVYVVRREQPNRTGQDDACSIP